LCIGLFVTTLVTLMPASSRFAVAVHLLTLLEASAGEPLTSEWMARSVNTNPVVVRRLLGLLARAGLTTCRLGAGGGTRLAKPASAITLRDVYRAVAGGDLFAMHRVDPSPECPVGRQIQAVLQKTTCAAQGALEAELDRRTVASMVSEVQARERTFT
jgi:DNA-binding IscR family transcriptional regulator